MVPVVVVIVVVGAVLTFVMAEPMPAVAMRIAVDVG